MNIGSSHGSVYILLQYCSLRSKVWLPIDDMLYPLWQIHRSHRTPATLLPAQVL